MKIALKKRRKRKRGFWEVLRAPRHPGRVS